MNQPQTFISLGLCKSQTFCLGFSFLLYINLANFSLPSNAQLTRPLLGILPRSLPSPENIPVRTHVPCAMVPSPWNTSLPVCACEYIPVCMWRHHVLVETQSDSSVLSSIPRLPSILLIHVRAQSHQILHVLKLWNLPFSLHFSGRYIILSLPKFNIRVVSEYTSPCEL